MSAVLVSREELNQLYKLIDYKEEELQRALQEVTLGRQHVKLITEVLKHEIVILI